MFLAHAAILPTVEAEAAEAVEAAEEVVEVEVEVTQEVVVVVEEEEEEEGVTQAEEAEEVVEVVMEITQTATTKMKMTRTKARRAALRQHRHALVARLQSRAATLHVHLRSARLTVASHRQGSAIRRVATL